MEVTHSEGQMEYEEHGAALPASLPREGNFDACWQEECGLLFGGSRNIVGQPDVAPQRDVISAFDTSPLSGRFGFSIRMAARAFQVETDALAKLTGGLFISALGQTIR